MAGQDNDKNNKLDSIMQGFVTTHEVRWEDLPKYEALAEAFGALIYVCSQDFKVEFMNKNFIARTGYNPVGQLCYKALHGLEEVCPHCVNERVFRGENLHWEAKSPKDNHWYEIVCMPIRHTDGRILKMAILRDITPHKQIAAALRESEERYRMLAETAQDFIYIIEDGWKVKYINSVAVKYMRKSQEEIVGKPLDEVFVAETVEFLKSRLHVVFETGEPRSSEDKVRFVAGQEAWLDTNLVPVKDPEGKVTAVMGISRNITERKHTEEALQESQRMLYALLGNLPGMAYRCRDDQERTMEFVSNGCFELTGYQSADLIQNNKISYNQLVYPEDRKAVESQIQIALSKKKPFRLNYRIKDAAGEEEWVWEQGRGVFSFEGKLIAIEGFITNITNAKRLENTLQEARDMYRRVINGVAGYVYTVKMDGGKPVETIHGAGCSEITGYTPEEFSADRHLWLKIVPAEDRALVEEYAHTVISGKVTQPIEHRIIRKDKAVRWIRNSPVLYFDAQGGLLSYDGLVQDITERRFVEEALRKSEERYRLIVESQTEMITRFLPDGTITFVNEAYSRYFHKKTEEFIGKTFLPLIYKDDLEKLKPHIEKFNPKNPVATIEYRVVLPNGEVRWQQWNNRAIFDNRGQLVEFQSVGQDITERKKMEDTQRKTERFLSNIFSSIQDGISVLDKDLNIVRVNSTMEKWYSHAMPLVGKKCFDAYHSSSKACNICPTRLTIETQQAAYEVIPKCAEGGKVVGWLDLYSFPLIDKTTGEMSGVIEYVRDITERKKAEEDLAVLNKELTKSNKRLKRLAMLDSHTGLFNHRYMGEIVEAEFSRAKRYASSLSVIMLDIDYFKSINDVYGHQFGDLVLRQCARLLKKMLRRYDTVIRYGGEEFVIICPGTDRAQAFALAQRILDAIHLFDFGNQVHRLKLKLSMAVSAYPEDKAADGMGLVEVSDQLLNKAKESGGNRVYSSMDIKEQSKAEKEKPENTDIDFLKEKLHKLTKRANQSLIEAVFAFAKTIEVKDHYTGEHAEKTIKYANAIAEELGLSEGEIENIRQAAVLHDLGKIGISERILLKKASLTKSEFKELKKHPQIGADIIRPIQFLHSVIPLVLYHHERWDGKGYPTGLKGEEIPMGARVISIADAYQALTSDRPYRKAYTQKQAIGIIKEEAGVRYDPKIVNIFLKILQRKKIK